MLEKQWGTMLFETVHYPGHPRLYDLVMSVAHGTETVSYNRHGTAKLD